MKTKFDFCNKKNPAFGGGHVLKKLCLSGFFGGNYVHPRYGVLYMTQRCWRDILGNTYILLKNDEFRGVRYLKCSKMMKTHPNNII